MGTASWLKGNLILQEPKQVWISHPRLQKEKDVRVAWLKDNINSKRGNCGCCFAIGFILTGAGLCPSICDVVPCVHQMGK